MPQTWKLHEMPKIPDGAQERYHLFQHQMEHEQDNKNQKVVWHAISQSFLFSAYTSLMNAPPQPKTALFGFQQEVLLWTLPIVALPLSILSSTSIVSSLRYICRLKQNFEEKFGPVPDEMPALQGGPYVFTLGNLAAYGLLATLIFTWVIILCAQTFAALRG